MASYRNGSITLENVYGKKTYETTIVDCSSAGDYSIKVENIESDWSGSGGGNSPYWDRDSYENRIIEPNKHYDTGFSTIICYKFNYNTQKLETNQFIIPLASYYTVGPGKRRIKFGEVELELNSIETKYNLRKETDTYQVDTTFYLTYILLLHQEPQVILCNYQHTSMERVQDSLTKS